VGADVETVLVKEIAITPANINDGKSVLMLCPTIPARFLPTAPIAATISAKRCAPRVERHASPPACEDGTRLKRLGGSKPGTGRSPRSWSDREDLRHMETKLRPSSDGMARAYQGGQNSLTAIAYDIKRSLKVIHHG